MYNHLNSFLFIKMFRNGFSCTNICIFLLIKLIINYWFGLLIQRHPLFVFSRYFLQEIQLGETLISTGDIERGVEHLANAVIVCGQPTQLLQVLQQTLPAQVFGMLIQQMQNYGNKVAEAQKQHQPQPVTISDELE